MSATPFRAVPRARRVFGHGGSWCAGSGTGSASCSDPSTTSGGASTSRRWWTSSSVASAGSGAGSTGSCGPSTSGSGASTALVRVVGVSVRGVAAWGPEVDLGSGGRGVEDPGSGAQCSVAAAAGRSVCLVDSGCGERARAIPGGEGQTRKGKNMIRYNVIQQSIIH